jgi:hypothetical protein
MKQFKIIKEKFPFLEEFVSIYKPNIVKVAKAKTDLLNRTGYSYSHYWTTGYSVKYEHYFVFDGKDIHHIPHEGVDVQDGYCYDAWQGKSINTFCTENNIKPELIIQLKLDGKDIEMIIYQLSSTVKSVKRNRYKTKSKR